MPGAAGVSPTRALRIEPTSLLSWSLPRTTGSVAVLGFNSLWVTYSVGQLPSETLVKQSDPTHWTAFDQPQVEAGCRSKFRCPLIPGLRFGLPRDAAGHGARIPVLAPFVPPLLARRDESVRLIQSIVRGFDFRAKGVGCVPQQLRKSFLDHPVAQAIGQFR